MSERHLCRARIEWRRAGRLSAWAIDLWPLLLRGQSDVLHGPLLFAWRVVLR
jgi:hypothetical protein